MDRSNGANGADWQYRTNGAYRLDGANRKNRPDRLYRSYGIQRNFGWSLTLLGHGWRRCTSNRHLA